MSNQDTRYPKGYYKQHPKKLPPILKGHDFHAVTKIRLNGNENRTTLFEFLPKQFKALIEGIDKIVERAVSEATKKLKRKHRTLKSELKQANEIIERLDSTLAETAADRDEALDLVRQLTKEPSKPSGDPQKVKDLERELRRIKGLFEQKNDENKSLNTQLKNILAGDQKDKTDLSKALKANSDLTTYLKDLKTALLAHGINLDEAVPETSGMISASTLLANSTILHSNKPVPNGNPGTRR